MIPLGLAAEALSGSSGYPEFSIRVGMIAVRLGREQGWQGRWGALTSAPRPAPPGSTRRSLGPRDAIIRAALVQARPIRGSQSDVNWRLMESITGLMSIRGLWSQSQA